MPSTPSRTSIVTLGFTALLVFITGYLLSSLVSPQSIFPDGLRVFDRSPLDVVTGILSEELGRVRKRDEDEEMPAKGPLINTKNGWFLYAFSGFVHCPPFQLLDAPSYLIV